ncbi:MAG: spore coat protein [Limnochordaceae bacterium]|nr:spore coat protein [Limnochordaceae bacterium]
MQDKDFASDILGSVKMHVDMFTKAAQEASTPQLRQALINLRNQCEQTQWQLFELARNNNWYQVPKQASADEVQKVASMAQQAQPAMAEVGTGADGFGRIRV